MKKKKGPSNPDIKGGKSVGEKTGVAMKTGAIDSFRTTKGMSRQGNLGCLGGYLSQSGTSHTISSTYTKWGLLTYPGSFAGPDHMH